MSARIRRKVVAQFLMSKNCAFKGKIIYENPYFKLFIGAQFQ